MLLHPLCPKYPCYPLAHLRQNHVVVLNTQCVTLLFHVDYCVVKKKNSLKPFSLDELYPSWQITACCEVTRVECHNAVIVAQHFLLATQSKKIKIITRQPLCVSKNISGNHYDPEKMVVNRKL